VLERLEPLEATDDASLWLIPVVFPELFGLSRFLLLWEVIRHGSFSFVWFLPLVASVASFSGWFRHGRIDLLFVLNLMILFVYLFVEFVDPIVK